MNRSQSQNYYIEPKINNISNILPPDNAGFKVVQKTELVDLNLNTDYSEKLLGEVGSNLREIDRNIHETGVNIKAQGDTIKNMKKTVEETNENLNKANVTIRSLSWGQRVQLILLNLISFFLFIGIIVLLILRFLRSGSENK
jgi:methyl-accepting chemotaxis protein